MELTLSLGCSVQTGDFHLIACAMSEHYASLYFAPFSILKPSVSFPLLLTLYLIILRGSST